MFKNAAILGVPKVLLGNKDYMKELFFFHFPFGCILHKDFVNSIVGGLLSEYFRLLLLMFHDQHNK